MQEIDTENVEENIVIVGAGIAGLATALGLHRLGIRSVVLESSDSLRITGFAIGIWSNAWKALDALAVGDSLRRISTKIQGSKVKSPGSSLLQPDAEIQFGETIETRCMSRKDLLETLEKELPRGTIKYSSKIISIEESGNSKLLHLSNGSVVKTKVLIGCDGVNSRVAKYLGLPDPVSAGRSAIRGLANFKDGHGFEPKLHVYVGGGFRCGIIPCDENCLYWWFSFSQSIIKYDESEQDPLKMKQFVLSNIVKSMPKHVSEVVESTELNFIAYSALKFRLPWDILRGNIAKNNVCVAGDALHPMTPDIGQGGCSALEDSIVLARCLAEALSVSDKKDDDGDRVRKVEMGLEKYAKERRLRNVSVVCAAYMVGFVQESKGVVMSFLRKKFLAKFTVWTAVKISRFDCGKLN